MGAKHSSGSPEATAQQVERDVWRVVLTGIADLDPTRLVVLPQMRHVESGATAGKSGLQRAVRSAAAAVDEPGFARLAAVLLGDTGETRGTGLAFRQQALGELLPRKRGGGIGVTGETVRKRRLDREIARRIAEQLIRHESVVGQTGRPLDESEVGVRPWFISEAEQRLGYQWIGYERRLVELPGKGWQDFLEITIRALRPRVGELHLEIGKRDPQSIRARVGETPLKPAAIGRSGRTHPRTGRRVGREARLLLPHKLAIDEVATVTIESRLPYADPRIRSLQAQVAFRFDSLEAAEISVQPASSEHAWAWATEIRTFAGAIEEHRHTTLQMDQGEDFSHRVAHPVPGVVYGIDFMVLQDIVGRQPDPDDHHPPKVLVIDHPERSVFAAASRLVAKEAGLTELLELLVEPPKVLNLDDQEETARFVAEQVSRFSSRESALRQQFGDSWDLLRRFVIEQERWSKLWEGINESAAAHGTRR